jgi:hypothetical protein
VVVRGVDVGVRLRSLFRRVELRDLGGDGREQADAERRRPQCEENREEGEQSELADAPPLGTA